MMADFVFPENNEEEFIKVAEKLSYTELVFIYKNTSKEDYAKETEKLKSLSTKIKVNQAQLCTAKNINKSFSDILIAEGSNNARQFIEEKKVDILYNLEENSRKDFIHHRSSGLNQVLCKLAHENKIIVAFSLNKIIESSGKNRAILLGRIKQNIMLCRKYKVPTIIASFAKNPWQMRSPRDIFTLFTLLGMDTKTIKNSLDYKP